MPIHPHETRLEEMARREAGEPIVMLNLLRFRKQAERGHGVDGMTGEEAFGEYGRAFGELQPRYGGTPIWLGKTEAVIIGADDEAWDLAILVRYPTRGKFLAMLDSPQYQAIAPLRAAALSDSRLIEMTERMSTAG